MWMPRFAQHKYQFIELKMALNVVSIHFTGNLLNKSQENVYSINLCAELWVYRMRWLYVYRTIYVCVCVEHANRSYSRPSATRKREACSRKVFSQVMHIRVSTSFFDVRLFLSSTFSLTDID